MQKRSLGPCVTFFPQPTTLIASRDADGRPNLMTASWVGILSKTPPTMGVAVFKGRLTYQNIKANGEFTVNLIPASLATEADYCGLRSGRDADKPEICGLTLAPAKHVQAPVVEESPLNVECRLSSEVELGDYRLLLGEILDIHAADAAFRADGSADARVFDPLVYLGGIREYWNLGDCCAPAYQVGKSLFNKEK